MSEERQITFGILTVSDTCTSNPDKDKSGPLLAKLVTDTSTKTGKLLKGVVLQQLCVPDEQEVIEGVLKDWSDDKIAVNVIITTGGTGFTKRDVTPEATKNVVEKEVTSIPLVMMMESLKITPLAMLSRAKSGIRNKTLIINLPGSAKAVKECLEAIALIIPHSVNLILGIEIKKHPTFQQEEFSSTDSCGHSHKITKSHVADRLRQSPFPMISVSDALNIIACESANHSKSIEYVPLKEAFQRILGEDVHSICDLPPFRASIKDGYAVIHDDNIASKKVLTGITAGEEPGDLKLKPGYCVRVNTGCPIPENATAVVQVEDTQLVSKNEQTGEEIEVKILIEPKLGQDIRPVGCDIKKEDLILESKTKLGSAEIGILSACGLNKVPVIKAVNIGVMSTGNELQEPGETAKKGCVYDSNKITLQLLLKEHGYNSLDLGVVRDEESTMISALEESLKNVDVLITTGSVSMGDRDLLKPILQKHFNAIIHFGRVDLKPGKPTTFATCSFRDKNKYIFCLPGNPVSATVTTYLFVVPLLQAFCGSRESQVTVDAKLTFSYKLDQRPDYVRTKLVWENNQDLPCAKSTGDQISSKLTSFKNANALLIMPKKTPEKEKMNIGDIVPAILLSVYYK